MHHINGQILGNTVNIDTLYFAWASMAVILLCSAFFTAGISADTGKYGVRQHFAESLFGFIRNLVRDQIGKRADEYVFFIGSIFIFILTSYYAGLIPWKLGAVFSWWPQIPVHEAAAHGHHAAVQLHPWHGASPVADINIPAAMAVIVIFVYVASGIKVAGWKYVETFLPIRFSQQGWAILNPMCLIELMDLAVRPLTLSLRLFANTVAGETLLVTFIGFCWLLVPLPILGFELAVGLLQSFIFTILATVYIATAVQHAEHLAHH